MLSYKEILAMVGAEATRYDIDRQPASLYAPILYAIECGGKRLRPTLTLLAYNIYKEDVEQALPAAMAIETYHNYTLLHDDLMDNSLMRRGRPTVHAKWDANTAILSGDAMLTYAMRMMLAVDDRHLREAMDLFTETALQVCEGQQYDMDFEGRNDVSEAEYIEMIRLKTSVLLACALKTGALLADAPDTDAAHLYAFGEQLGIAFQLQDDYLDVYGDPATFGKNIGGDILCGKKTYMLINALSRDHSGRLEELLAWQPATDDERQRKIGEVTAIYDALGIPELARQRIGGYFAEAAEHLMQVGVDDGRKQQLTLFAHTLMARQK